MLDDDTESRKNDKKKATSHRYMKWLLGKLIDVLLTLALEQTLTYLCVHTLASLEHIDMVKTII
ncbi:hypothetical protein ACK33E_14110 [Aeromonas hydrophila]|uniref:hypothetical protein n=1 Tax=Aeromonas hydrophila TaxID=644 RepID=UPI003989C6D7